MTPEQESQFKNFGCIPRSLMKLTETGQKPVTKEEFCEKFGDRFHNPDKQYGLLNPDHIPEIARELKLPGAAGAPPTKLVWEPDYDKVATLHRTGSRFMVASDINLNQGANDVNKHCSVLQAIDAKSFTLWTSSQDGNEHILQFPRSAWAEKQCRGMVLI